jgi:translation initiation factor IF-3
VRLIDEKGEQLGVLTLTEALSLAAQKELDLVEIVPTAQPPVCKLVGYAKFKYQIQKKERLQKAHQKSIETKILRLHLNTSPHDMEVKAGTADRFLNKGNKVKADLRLKGRENARPQLAIEKLKLFLTLVKTTYKITSEPKREKGLFSVTIEKQ